MAGRAIKVSNTLCEIFDNALFVKFRIIGVFLSDNMK